MFTDIVFVLDYSGSVSSTEWTQTSKFVIGVMNSFAFGDQGAAAACIKFTTSAQGLAYGTYNGQQTVTTNKADLINTMSTERKPSGGTCQGSGLELAKQYFDHSPRKSKNVHKIVIAITDGSDGCRSRTQTAAKTLRETYDAFFIGVGVGIMRESDRQFIKDLTTQIAGQPSYYPVDNYGEIHTLVNKLFTPMCDKYSYDYGSACKGFRGCGKCFCPNCTIPSDACKTMSCTARDGTSNGCVLGDKNCNQAQSTWCVPRTCEAGTCKVGDACANERNRYKQKCQSVSCDNNNKKCIVSFDDATCKLRHKKDCELWRCQPNANTAGEDDYGCVMVTNVTKDCINKQKKCLTVKCNTETLSCDITDNCAKQNNECHKFTCEGEGNSAVCTNHDVTRPDNLKDNQCTKYKCFNDSGWKKDEASSLNSMKCRTKSVGEGLTVTCLIFSCDDNKGCQNKTDTKCSAACASLEDKCWSNVTKSLDKCQLTRCEATTASDAHCEYNTTDCTKSEQAQRAETLNKQSNNTACYTYYCTYGTCEFAEVLPRHKSTKCVTWTCAGSITKGWEWVMSYTDEHDNCHSDACYLRECDDEEGCIPVKDICEANTTKCMSYTCDKNVTCTPKNLLRNLDCLREECKSDGTVLQIWTPVKEACPHAHNCTIATCPDDEDDKNFGRCVYTETEHGMDNCTKYTCNTTDDTWIESPKCDDHHACTEDLCSVDGDCWSVDIDCYKEINMTGYPCFKAACKEDPSAEKGYRCVRRIKSGAYIDICGRCVREGELGSSENKTKEEEKSLECTDAPEEPILKEGIAAASVAMIVLLAVVVGGAITTSGIIGTKTLLERARAANNQSAHSNPLFEDNAAEMMNPTFTGEN